MQATDCELVVEGLKQSHGLPVSINLDNLSIHNLSDYAPLGICISSAPVGGPLSRVGRQGAGAGGVTAGELRQIEEAVMGRLEQLEQHLSFGALATLQAIDRDPRGKAGGGQGAGGHDSAMVLKALRQQLRDHAAEMQRTRRGIAQAFQPTSSMLADEGGLDEVGVGVTLRGGEERLKDSASSLAQTRGMLEKLMVEILGSDADRDSVELLRAAAGSTSHVRASSKAGDAVQGRGVVEDDDLFGDQIDAEEMVEIFEAFCEEDMLSSSSA
jgi:hypothetical protein